MQNNCSTSKFTSNIYFSFATVLFDPIFLQRSISRYRVGFLTLYSIHNYEGHEIWLHVEFRQVKTESYFYTFERFVVFTIVQVGLRWALVLLLIHQMYSHVFQVQTTPSLPITWNYYSARTNCSISKFAFLDSDYSINNSLKLWTHKTKFLCSNSRIFPLPIYARMYQLLTHNPNFT